MIKRISPKRKKELAEYSKTMKEMEGVAICENYGVEGCTVRATEHHHIIYRSEAPKHENLHNRRNIAKLCRACHDWLHNKKDNRKEFVTMRKLWFLFPELRLKERYIEN